MYNSIVSIEFTVFNNIISLWYLNILWASFKSIKNYNIVFSIYCYIIWMRGIIYETASVFLLVESYNFIEWTEDIEYKKTKYPQKV